MPKNKESEVRTGKEERTKPTTRNVRSCSRKMCKSRPMCSVCLAMAAMRLCARLVDLRDYQDDKADIILEYMPDEARMLNAYYELPETTRLNEGISTLDEEDDGVGDDYIEF